MKYLALFALFAVAACNPDGLLDILDPVDSIFNPIDGILNPIDGILNPIDGILDPLLDRAYYDFKKTFNKTYSSMEDLIRRLNFESTVTSITKHNLMADLGLSSYKLGLNKYSDLTLHEIANQLFGFKGDNNYTSESSSFNPPKNVTASSSVDWRKKGLVTPVKDQAQCGSCWSFSATGALEGQLKKKTGKLVSLSEQNLIDCSRSEGNNGCNGGWMNQAFKYIKKNGGIDTADAYPYTGEEGNCSFTKEGLGGTVTGYVNIPSGDEAALMKALSSVGPVSTAVNAGGDFSMYESGIYSPPVCPNTIYDLTHAVLIVGYGREDGQDYWLVKNSWGESYGINGYIKMARNKNNLCGIATKASYPLV